MGQTATTLGIGPTLEFEGKHYRVSPLTWELQAKFETWLEKRALDKVRQHRNTLPAAEYDTLLKSVMRDIAAGVYSFGGEMSVRASQSIPGAKHLLYLELNKCHPEVDEEFTDRIFQAKLEAVTQALTVANADPKASTPTVTPSGEGI
jgi:hypothetical protein